jgi:predicted metalloprotease
MRWSPGHQSQDLEDRRGESGGGGGGGLGGRHIGIGGLLVLLLLSVVFKRNFFSLLGDGGGGTSASSTAGPAMSTPAEDSLVQFVSFVLDDAQSTWERLLPAAGTSYTHAHLVLFRDGIASACGFAQSATGPFYCPGDERVYIDLGFYQELRDRFGAPGDFAQAYVLAHEIGHHVQHLLGLSDKVHQAEERRPGQANALSVRLELQADCYAGIWAKSTEQRNLLEGGDVEEGLKAAASVGDDRLQRMATGHVNPDAFTHGTSAQRAAWFQRGLQQGRLDACDTFASKE